MCYDKNEVASRNLDRNFEDHMRPKCKLNEWFIITVLSGELDVDVRISDLQRNALNLSQIEVFFDNQSI